MSEVKVNNGNIEDALKRFKPPDCVYFTQIMNLRQQCIRVDGMDEIDPNHVDSSWNGIYFDDNVFNHIPRTAGSK